MFYSGQFSLYYLRNFAGIATSLQLFKMYDWLKLFEPTSFYVKLIAITVKEIRWFILLFVIALVACGIPISFLDFTRIELDRSMGKLEDDEDSNRLIKHYFDVWILDAVMN